MITRLSVLLSEATIERSILCCTTPSVCLEMISEQLWRPNLRNAKASSQSQAGLPAQGSAGTLDAVLEALLRGASTHIEPQTRKTCVQVWRPAQMTMHLRLYVETCAVSTQGLLECGAAQSPRQCCACLTAEHLRIAVIQ